MNAYLHSIIAVLSIYIAYWLGQHHGREAFVENIVSCLMTKLADEGFIRTVTDKDGELELVPISEIVAKSLREAKNYV